MQRLPYDIDSRSCKETRRAVYLVCIAHDRSSKTWFFVFKDAATKTGKYYTWKNNCSSNKYLCVPGGYDICCRYSTCNLREGRQGRQELNAIVHKLSSYIRTCVPFRPEMHTKISFSYQYPIGPYRSTIYLCCVPKNRSNGTPEAKCTRSAFMGIKRVIRPLPLFPDVSCTW